MPRPSAPDDTPGDAPTTGTSDADATRTTRRLFRVTVCIAAAPILVSALRNGRMGWYPTRDAALTAIWTRDVFGGHLPLYGLPTSFSRGAALPFHYLGAVHLYVLAVPVKLLGVSWGILVGMAVMNTAWTVLALWLLRRRVGYRLALVGSLLVTLLVWTLGSQVLIDPTPVQTGALTFFAFCVSAWSVADTDARGLVPLALTADYLFLTHPQYVLVVPALSAYAVGVMTIRLVRRRRHDRDRWRGERARIIRATVGAVAVAMAMWAPAIVEQLFRPGGNIRAWLTSMLHQRDASHHGLLDVVRVVASPMTVPPFWFRESITHQAYNLLGPTANAAAQMTVIGVVVAILAALGVVALRRRDATTSTGVAAAALAWTAWTVTVWRQPGRSYNYHYLLTSWPLAAFVTTVVVLGVARATRADDLLGRGARYRIAAGGLAAVTALFAGLTVPVANFRSGTPQANIPPANRIRHAIRAGVPQGPPVLVVARTYPSRSYLPVAILELESMGIPVRVPAGWDTVVYRPFRGVRDARPGPERRLVIAATPAGTSASAELLAFGGPRLSEAPETYVQRWRALRARVEEMGTDDPGPDTPGAGTDAAAAFAEIRREYTTRRNTALDSPDAVDWMLALDEDDLASVLDVPGIDGPELTRWLEDQLVVLDRKNYFVLLDPSL